MNLWWSMHGYALYIWSSYGVVGVVLGGYAIYTHLYGQRVSKILKQLSSKIL